MGDNKDAKVGTNSNFSRSVENSIIDSPSTIIKKEGMN